MPTDEALLQLQIETGWISDDRGRLLRVREANGRHAPILVLAAARDGCAIGVGSDLEDALAARLIASVKARPFDVQATVACCERLLTQQFGSLSITSGPAYVIHAGSAFPSSEQIVLSSDQHASPLLDARPDDSGWSPEEWHQLIDGDLGPWAIAMIDGQVASICHAARFATRAADAGVWTHERFRGRGLAPAVTAAWANLITATGRTVFYRTSAGNLASQRVAAKLRLRHIGTIWQFHRASS